MGFISVYTLQIYVVHCTNVHPGRLNLDMIYVWVMCDLYILLEITLTYVIYEHWTEITEIYIKIEFMTDKKKRVVFEK